MFDQILLLVDDEADILRLLQTTLNKEGFNRVYTASTAEAAWREFQLRKPDLVVLDVMLPDGEGYEVCRKIRAVSPIPIFFLSARTEELDKILGFAIGGDDYVTKPFSPRELAYRIKARFRSAELTGSNSAPSKTFCAGGFEFDEPHMEIRMNGTPLDLTPKELGLLAFLVKNPGRLFSKETLYTQVWGEDSVGIDNTIMVHIRRLREKIEVNPSAPVRLVTVKGLGYKLMVDDR
ncbi:DNA-binding response regulator [Saccharibacillus sp. O16]|nr:DNA-binding response regulator [Saccharibacillus sp. O16]